MVDESALRESLCEMGRRLYARNLVAATDGNLSCRLAENRYLVTPSGVSKGFMKPDDIVVADGKGGNVMGVGKVSSEFLTHLAAYDGRPDVNAVVHAHPPTAIGLMLAGEGMEALVLPEVVYAVGGIPTAPYATPGTPEGAESVRDLVRACDALLMDRHGALTLGHSIEDAYFKMEKVEHAAGSLLIARLLGKTETLSDDQIKRLYAMRDSYGIAGKFYRPGE